ncbi:MAG: hypothetical protein BYD32DRAFT_475543 [Podila humilis]|nr:MAG: hypothetical protein BYD32DRAFT_475543 [Podila humilis]
MQSDGFKRLRKDLQGALGIPNRFWRKSKKVANQDTHDTNQETTLPGSMASNQRNVEVKIEKASPDVRLNELSSFADIGKSVKLDDGQFLVPPHKWGFDTENGVSGEGGPVTGLTPNSILSSAGSPISPISPGEFKGLSSKAASLVHLPSSVNNLDKLSPQRLAWVRNFLDTTPSTHNSNISRSEPAWDIVDVSPAGKVHHTTSSRKQGISDTLESTGLFIVKTIQVTNKASNKIFDIEWNLRVGNVDKTSHSVRSFKDNPGNTATMNEVFMFDVNEPFQLDMSLTGYPVATKLGTMAGFSNSQAVHLGQLQLSFCLETTDRTIRTYKLRPSAANDNDKSTKCDCEVVVMIGLHVLEEPVEDRTWEKASRYEGFLTFMTRGARMSSWKRYWAVLEGRAIKLYDAEYRMKRGVVAVIPLAHLTGVHPPDLEKVNVGANGFSLAIAAQGVDMTSNGEFSDIANMDYCLYSFTDSLQMRDVWTTHLQEALNSFQVYMTQRRKVQQRNLSRRAVQSLSRHSFESSVPPSPFEGGDGEDPISDLVELKFVW